MEVVQFTYRVVYLVGGQADGKGHYIGYAGIQPAEIQVAWGFDFSVNGHVPMVFNRGTKADPIAGMQILLNCIVKTPFKETQKSSSFLLDGSGVFKTMN